MNEKIFKYIYPNKNDIFSNINGSDLLELFNLLDDYYIEYRDSLNFSKDITFGLELEFENVKYRKLLDKFNALKSEWIMKHDPSLDDGAEINSPILTDEKIYWDQLKKICLFVQKNGHVGLNSGGHVHIGAHILENEKLYFLNFVKLWSVYENVIFRFCYGEFLTERVNMYKYAAPVSNDFWNAYNILKNNLDNIKKRFLYEDRRAVNLDNFLFDCGYFLKNTIEFRCPNGTLDPVIWQNNVNLFVKLLKYSKSNNFNDDLLSKRHEMNKNEYSNLEYYKEIYLDEAIEFCDLIFNNNLDKINFLRQYLKSFKIGNGKLDKVKKFTSY